jgi:3'-phosphoadenosine 5'-phosphosulfate sulfotransferase (PAPS reductase)/FAD synthetase
MHALPINAKIIPIHQVQLGLLEPLAESATERYGISINQEIADLLLDPLSTLALSTSGGKDSIAMAHRVNTYLDEIGFKGVRVLIHSDLGRVEWRDSLPACERLAKQLGMELMVVRRKAGDMLSRWQGRWAANARRYENLECVKLTLPWSTPKMRFCTSELKHDVISAALRKRFPKNPIISVSGIRRAESSARAKMPVSSKDTKLTRKGAVGVMWNAIIDWSTPDVFQYHADHNIPLHEAYTKYGASRVSCAYCIMSSKQDLRAAANCSDNVPVYREMVELEANSSFAFQDKWLADTAPEHLSDDLRARVQQAKQAAELRQAAESVIPDHLLYSKGWPTCIPSPEEAEMLASVRRRVGALLGLNMSYVDGPAVLARYEDLMAQKLKKEAEKTRMHAIATKKQAAKLLKAA